MPDVKTVLRLACWLLPASDAKNATLRRLGHDVHATAQAHMNLVWKVDQIRLRPGSQLKRLNVIKNMRLVELGEQAVIGRLNVLSAHPVFKRLYHSGAQLLVGNNGKITSRHQLDCSGGIRIGELSSLAGHNTRIVSHSTQVASNAQAAFPVLIGNRSFVGTHSLILGGAELPNRSVLGAGSVLLAPKAGESPSEGLWAGSPAKFKRELEGAWFDRAQASTRRVLIPETGEIVEDAF